MPPIANKDLPRRRLAIALALAGLAVVAGCGSDSSPSSAAASPASPAAPSTASTTPPVTATSAPSTGSAAPVLSGTVGSKDNPDAFVIGLTDSAGKPVSTLPAGTYTIKVQDPSKIHNFHLKGGTVDQTTTVPEVTDKSFQVNLTAGEYTFVCDPHPRMTGTFTVT